MAQKAKATTKRKSVVKQPQVVNPTAATGLGSLVALLPAQYQAIGAAVAVAGSFALNAWMATRQQRATD